ncbi:uncharacterized protein [Battus philenor]|uniref:uncharacterized protein n=1 Tax=Battus philenor TaxID=42288 RepID=UPI0035D0FCAD
MAPFSLKVDGSSPQCTTPSERNGQRLVSVKVGCLHINPTSKHGRRKFLIQLLALCFIPHAALILQNCTAMAQLLKTLDASLYLDTEVQTNLAVGETVMSFQDERLTLTKTKFLQTITPEESRAKLEEAFFNTDKYLEELPDTIMDDRLRRKLVGQKSWSDLTSQLGTPLMMVVASCMIFPDWSGGSKSRAGSASSS